MCYLCNFKKIAIFYKELKLLARSGRFELPTPRFVVWCSIQLSYERAFRTGKRVRDGYLILSRPECKSPDGKKPGAGNRQPPIVTAYGRCRTPRLRS